MADVLTFTESGIYCPAGDFYIDPWRRVPRALITHAHSDHARWGMDSYLATPTTAAVMRHRLGDIAVQTIAYDSALRIGDAVVSFHPAGHVPGSAQIRVAVKGQVWVVSGDYKIVDDGLSEPFAPVPCHAFISECTFGLPIFNWTPQDVLRDQINRWWAESAAAGKTAILGAYATPENVERLNRQLGLDRPLWQQYFIWLGNLLQGDFGRSFALNRPVLDEILDRFSATLILAGTAFVLCSALGIAAGVVSAARQYGFADRAITFVVILGISVPSFFLGMMMILLFAVQLRWLPASGMYAVWGGGGVWDLIRHLTMPALALAVVATGVIARLSRGAMLEVLRQDFIRTARAKGVHERRVIWRHALRAAMVGIIPVLGIQAGFVLSGAVYIEMVFQWPGVGRMLVDAILKRDILLVQGGVVFVAACYVGFNILVDVAQSLLDPRIRT